MGPHGVQGEIRVRVLGDGPRNLLSLARVELSTEPEPADPGDRIGYEIEGGGAGRKGEARLRLRGVDDREAAEALRGRWLLAEPGDLPSLGTGEFYWFELLGCRVECADGTPLGTVSELWETGPQDLLVVEGDDGRRRLIPTARELVTEIDPERRRIVIADLPGLTDPA